MWPMQLLTEVNLHRHALCFRVLAAARVITS